MWSREPVPRGPTIVVINGSIASGKSTLARAVAAELRNEGASCAVIDIDVLHGMVSDGLDPTWTIARQAAGAVTNRFLAGIQVVVIDGEFITGAERASYLEKVRTPATARFVTLRVGYDEACDVPKKTRPGAFPRSGLPRASLRDVEPGLEATPDTDLCQSHGPGIRR